MYVCVYVWQAYSGTHYNATLEISNTAVVLINHEYVFEMAKQMASS